MGEGGMVGLGLGVGAGSSSCMGKWGACSLKHD